jgi:antitoxin component YwqK of YwqJK toxin-antitoxin module
VNAEYDVFISYSRRNRRFVDRLVADLKRHHLRVWVDTLEISVGDQFRRKIEEGILSSRYFCIVISPASMISYYVRRLELETAFSYMSNTNRDSYILPILWKRPEEIPTMLGTYQYLDFSNIRKYPEQLGRLVKKISMDDEKFTGARWYKNIDISNMGFLVGIGSLNHVGYSGHSVRVFFESGVAVRVETYTDGIQDGYKELSYDEKGRLFENTLFRNGELVDTWRYLYDNETGLRVLKQEYFPGHSPHHVIRYDTIGNRVEEKHFKEDGTLDDSRGYAVKQYEYTDDGHLKTEVWTDSNGSVVKTVRY